MPQKVTFERFGGPEVLKLVEYTPTELGPDEIKIENRAIGINFKDTYFRSGAISVPLPGNIGGEGSGIVLEVGSAVNSFKKGDKVAYLDGDSYRDIVVVNEEKAVPIPEGVSFETAASVLLKGLTAQYLLHQLVYVPEAGETVLFHAAAGGVGSLFLQWAKHKNIRVIATASSKAKLDLAKSYGAWQTINYKEEDFAKRVAELTNGEKVRIVYDSVGKDTFTGSLQSLRKRGLLVSFGSSSGAVPPFDVRTLNTYGGLYITYPTVIIYADNAENRRRMAKQVFDNVAKGVLKVETVLYPLSEVVTAHTHLVERRTTGSLVLIPDKFYTQR